MRRNASLMSDRQTNDKKFRNLVVNLKTLSTYWGNKGFKWPSFSFLTLTHGSFLGLEILSLQIFCEVIFCCSFWDSSLSDPNGLQTEGGREGWLIGAERGTDDIFLLSCRVAHTQTETHSVAFFGGLRSLRSTLLWCFHGAQGAKKYETRSSTKNHISKFINLYILISLYLL